MAEVTGNTFTVQKLYPPSSMPLIAAVVTTNLPQTKEVYPYETGGITVAVPTTFTEQVMYPPSSLFEGSYISQYGDPMFNQTYTEIGLVFSEQTLYTPTALSGATSTQSNLYAVTGLAKSAAQAETITQFWS